MEKLKQKKLIDLTGKTFFKLTVLSRFFDKIKTTKLKKKSS